MFISVGLMDKRKQKDTLDNIYVDCIFSYLVSFFSAAKKHTELIKSERFTYLCSQFLKTHI